MYILNAYESIGILKIKKVYLPFTEKFSSLLSSKFALEGLKTLLIYWRKGQKIVEFYSYLDCLSVLKIAIIIKNPEYYW